MSGLTREGEAARQVEVASWWCARDPDDDQVERRDGQPEVLSMNTRAAIDDGAARAALGFDPRAQTVGDQGDGGGDFVELRTPDCAPQAPAHEVGDADRCAGLPGARGGSRMMGTALAAKSRSWTTAE